MSALLFFAHWPSTMVSCFFASRNCFKHFSRLQATPLLQIWCHNQTHTQHNNAHTTTHNTTTHTTTTTHTQHNNAHTTTHNTTTTQPQHNHNTTQHNHTHNHKQRHTPHPHTAHIQHAQEERERRGHRDRTTSGQGDRQRIGQLTQLYWIWCYFFRCMDGIPTLDLGLVIEVLHSSLTQPWARGNLCRDMQSEERSNTRATLQPVGRSLAGQM